MYNRLSFQDQLSLKYLQQNIILIQNRKSRYPEFKNVTRKKRTLTSVASQKQVYQNNKKLVEKLVEVKYNPAYVRKMYMGGHSLQAKSKTANLAGSKLLERCASVKMREIEQENRRLKRTIQCKKSNKKPLILPQI